jgi:hypothetical protein
MDEDEIYPLGLKQTKHQSAQVQKVARKLHDSIAQIEEAVNIID